MNAPVALSSDWFSFKEAGAYLGLDWRTVRRLTQTRQIPCTRLSGVRVLIHRAACDAFMRRMRGEEVSAAAVSVSSVSASVVGPVGLGVGVSSNRSGRRVRPGRIASAAAGGARV